MWLILFTVKSMSLKGIWNQLLYFLFECSDVLLWRFSRRLRGYTSRDRVCEASRRAHGNPHCSPIITLRYAFYYPINRSNCRQVTATTIDHHLRKIWLLLLPTIANRVEIIRQILNVVDMLQNYGLVVTHRNRIYIVNINVQIIVLSCSVFATLLG